MSMFITSRRNLFLLTFLACLIFLLAGCAKPLQREAGPFWPPPPGEPRIQFLASYYGSSQIEETDRFRAFVVGNDGQAAQEHFVKPQGVTTIGSKVFVCDSMKNDVIKVDFVSKEWSSLNELNISSGGGGKVFGKPMSAATDGDQLYVVDSGHRAVLQFDADGKFLRTIGDNQLKKPIGVAAKDGRLYVADIAAAQVIVYELASGQALDTFGPDLEEGVRFGFPSALAFDPDGLLHVVDAAHRQVFRIDVDGHLISTLGRLGDASGTFTRPKGVAIDGDKRTWIVDAAFENVQVFNDEGRILTFFGGSGIDPGKLYLPSGLSISDQNLSFWQAMAAPGFQLDFVIFVTNQYGPNGLSVYGFGNKAGSS